MKKNLTYLQIKERLLNKTARIGVIGLGYVGLPLAVRIAEQSFKVIGFDTDPVKPSLLNQGKVYIKTISAERIKEIVKKQTFYATADFRQLKSIDCVIICVPTPLTETKTPDLTYIINSTSIVAKYLQRGQLIVLESTTFPGTTDEIILPMLEKNGFKEGVDFFLAFSPEREDPGNKSFSIGNIPKIVGGVSQISTEVVKLFYSQFVGKVVPVSSAKVAESAKMLENIYRAVNIALVNELKVLFDRMSIDVWEVIGAAATKPFGYHPFYPGPGLGGHCIPIDPFYLSWKAKQYDLTTRFIELAGEINTAMPNYVVEKIVYGLNHRRESIRDAKVLVLGVAYKKDIDDVRESPSLKIITLLEDLGARVYYNDPYVPEIPRTRHYPVAKKSCTLNKRLLNKMDCVLIATNHSNYDYPFILKNAKFIVDTRAVFKDWRKFQSKIVRA